jgi:hypothetical protein
MSKKTTVSAGEAIQRARDAILRAAAQLAGQSSLPADAAQADLAAWARELSTYAARVAAEARTLAEAIQAAEVAPSHSTSEGK